MKAFCMPLVTFAVLLLLSPAGAWCQAKRAAEEKTQPDAMKLRIEVTAGEKSQPVDNASVYVRYVEPRTLRKDKKVELNVKTNRDGIAKLPEIPSGKVLIQVIAQGWKTFGRWYELEAGEQSVKIHLEKPPRWY